MKTRSHSVGNQSRPKRRRVATSVPARSHTFSGVCKKKRGGKSLWNLREECGLGWACTGASVPKNGNNRPLSLQLEKLFPPKFLFCSLKASSFSFLYYVIARLLPVKATKKIHRLAMTGRRSRMNDTRIIS